MEDCQNLLRLKISTVYYYQGRALACAVQITCKTEFEFLIAAAAMYLLAQSTLNWQTVVTARITESNQD